MTKVYLKFSDSSLKLLNRLGNICFDICDVSGANNDQEDEEEGDEFLVEDEDDEFLVEDEQGYLLNEVNL